MIPPQVRIDLDIEVVLHIRDAGQDRGAHEAIDEAARYWRICEAAREHREGSGLVELQTGRLIWGSLKHD